MVTNGIPTEILEKIDIHSMHNFAGCIKQYLLLSYQESFTIVNYYISDWN